MNSKKDIAIERTVLALREILMYYFKDTAVDTVAQDTNVHIEEVPMLSMSHTYERRTHRMKRKCNVRIKSTTIITVERNPNVLIFKTVLNRSPEFRAIKEQLTPFLERYLPAVEVRGSNLSRLPSVDDDDAARIMENLPRKRGSNPYEELVFMESTNLRWTRTPF